MRISILILLIASAISLSANNIVIQLGVFEKPVDVATYFPDIMNVKKMADASGFHLYYVDGIKTEGESISLVSAYNQMGYTARIIDMKAVYACKTACRRPTITKSSKVYRSTLDHFYKVTEGYTPTELGEFEKVRAVMINNPNCTVVLDGQTTRLQCYLNMRGISNCRMTIKNNWVSVHKPVKVWVYDEQNIALNIEQEFKRMYS